MKKNLPIKTLAFCMMTSVASLAYADDVRQDNSSGSSNANAAATMSAQGDSKLAPNMSRASRVIGTEVVSAKGNKLGEVKDIVLDRQRGQVAYAVVAGTVSGAQNKYFAVPWKSLEARNDGTMRLNVEPEQMKNAPGFDKDKWPDMASQQWNTDVYRFYNQEPYWKDSVTARRQLGISSGESGEAAATTDSSADSSGSAAESDAGSTSGSDAKLNSGSDSNGISSGASGDSTEESATPETGPAAGTTESSSGGSAGETTDDGTFTPAHPASGSPETDGASDSSSGEPVTPTDGSLTHHGEGALESGSGADADARSSGNSDPLDEPGSTESSGDSADGQPQDSNQDRDEMINRSEQFGS